ncbi:AzlC family ABC transporter permease [Desulforudis sp. 1031]|uniref:AzlC family ABC transporter permease n=1 Tax=unclassified Candidatus Desulforudis TaxID=2635950 RepID=UPI003CE5670D
MLRPARSQDQSLKDPVTFSLSGALAGFRKSVPIALSVFAYGLVFGVLARQAGLSLAESVLMSGLVFAGASQFAVLGLWASPLPIGTIVLTTAIINLRHLLMGAVLYPWFSRLRPAAAYLTSFFIVDESWALTMGEHARGCRDAAFLLGSGIALFLAWVGATVAGGMVGDVLQDPSRWGLDFAFTAVFIALLVGFWKGKADLLPWVVAAVVAAVAAELLPGKWYILLGGLAGSLTGAMQNDD